MTEFYKIKHKPTGLFYKPGITNLSKQGKTYSRKPSFNTIALFHNFRISEALAKELTNKGYPVGKHKRTITGDTGFHIDVEIRDLEIVTYKAN